MQSLGKKGTATRQAILESARLAFTQAGYDAGVREIAEKAGVTAMLVNRYFGSKEQLFEEVVEATLAAPGILTQELMKNAPDMPTLCRDIATALVAKTMPQATPMDGFLILLRSANNAQATAILRKKFEAHFAQPLAGLLPGSETPQRAALFLAVIAGVQVLRQIVEMEALTEARPEYLARYLEALFSVLAAEQKS
ncbi:TetR/AcrR family transcriptional regulator [Silvimonas amylolytica]|uniref:TetR family transcriptional regulator n=1 Tax=Silvimonas amylolytica TaxID=449663 RepID=A0ABQ2PIX7_9NEIS|nr:TetR/AcrR family transcriptional regulator [Silvimonas amylolytica]GGP25300.1 TetR family transcriptional regulator [Silvimonas amylolytica]